MKKVKINWIVIEGIIVWGTVAIIGGVVLGGCNTVKGMAKDLYSVTEGIQDEMGNDSQDDDIRHNDWD
jgi:predicted small secreted protein